jgi:hypothetical protein
MTSPTNETVGTELPKKHLFWASMPFMNYIFAKGKMAVFRHHRYATDVPEEIEELTKEVKLGHPYISIKADMLYLTEEMEDPMKALKSKIIAEYMASQAKHVDPANDMGTSSQERIKPMSTTDVAAVAAGGDATQSAAKLVALTQQMAASATPATTKK